MRRLMRPGAHSCAASYSVQRERFRHPAWSTRRSLALPEMADAPAQHFASAVIGNVRGDCHGTLSPPAASLLPRQSMPRCSKGCSIAARRILSVYSGGLGQRYNHRDQLFEVFPALARPPGSGVLSGRQPCVHRAGAAERADRDRHALVRRQLRLRCPSPAPPLGAWPGTCCSAWVRAYCSWWARWCSLASSPRMPMARCSPHRSPSSPPEPSRALPSGST